MTKDCRLSENLARLCAGGMSIRAAAKKLRCSASRAYQLSGRAEFKQQVSKLRANATDLAVGQLSFAATEAAEYLRGVVADQTEKTTARINASIAILRLFGPLSELHELRARIDAIEQNQQAQQEQAAQE